MYIKNIGYYVDKLEKEYPKIERSDLMRIVRIFLQEISNLIVINEDITMKTKDFFLGIVSVRSKRDSDQYSYMKYKEKSQYYKNRQANKRHEQKNASNKYI